MDLDASIGSLFIGYTLSLWLYGITLSQIGLFFHNNSREISKRLRAVVWLLFILENAQTIALSEGVWLYLVEYRVKPAALTTPTRSFGVLVYATSLSNLLVRCVYAFRIHKLSQYIILPIFVVVLSLMVSTLACIYGTQGVAMVDWNSRLTLAWIFYTGYACELAADLIITASMVSILAGKNVGMRSSDSFTPTLLVYFLNSGLLVMICVICSTIAYIAMPNSLAFLAFYLVLGKLYGNSLLGSLNARDVIFHHANWENATPRSAPLLTSVVVLDDGDMVDSTIIAWEDSNKQTSGSIGSDKTCIEERLCKHQGEDDAFVRVLK